MNFIFNRAEASVRVRQKKFLQDIVSRYGVTRKSPTLALEDLLDDDPDSPLLAVPLKLLRVNPSWAFACKRTVSEG
jgi:hypothetical protein